MRKMYLISKIAFTILFVVIAMWGASAAPVAQGAIVTADLTGVRSTDGGGIAVVGAGGWSGEDNNGFQIEWEITSQTDGSWLYQYWISGVDGDDLTKSLSHLIIEVTDDAAAADFDWIEPSTIVPAGPDTFGDDGNSNSNPGILGDIYGVKWDTQVEGEEEKEVPTFYVEFETFRDPVWGDFYAKDGNDGGTWTYAYNTGFGQNVPADPPSNGYIQWIARPDGDGNNGMPEPSSLVVWGLGFALCVAAAALKRRRRR